MVRRFDPFRELDRAIDQTWSATRSTGLPMDAYRHGDTFSIQFDLPGVDPSTVDISVEQNTLTVSAERTFAPGDGAKVVAAERRHGKLSRKLYLGKTLDVENIEAAYEHGVLTLSIPVAETAKPRRIQVEVGTGPALETTTA